MSKRLENNQYYKFILEHILRPYQNMLPGRTSSSRIDRIVFHPIEKDDQFNYCDLIHLIGSHKDWWGCVTDRLARCYESIDFSFFPDEAFAKALSTELRYLGVEAHQKFDNAIYVK